MNKSNPTTRRSIAAAALALTTSLAACAGTPESAVVSSGSPVGAAPMSAVEELQVIERLTSAVVGQGAAVAPMSAVDEVRLIHGLTSEVAVPNPSSSPMSAADEVQLIGSISAQTPEAPHTATPSGSSHEYR